MQRARLGHLSPEQTALPPTTRTRSTSSVGMEALTTKEYPSTISMSSTVRLPNGQSWKTLKATDHSQEEVIQQPSWPTRIRSSSSEGGQTAPNSPTFGSSTLRTTVGLKQKSLTKFPDGTIADSSCLPFPLGSTSSSEVQSVTLKKEVTAQCLVSTTRPMFSI